MATTVFFYYLVGAYLMLFFTSHLTDPSKMSFKHATNHNETHYSAVVSGTVLGLLLRSRIR
jgi:hypothetical protein